MCIPWDIHLKPKSIGSSTQCHMLSLKAIGNAKEMCEDITTFDIAAPYLEEVCKIYIHKYLVHMSMCFRYVRRLPIHVYFERGPRQIQGPQID